MPPPAGLGGEGFRYVGVDPPRSAAAVPDVRGVSWALTPAVRRAWRRQYERVATQEHAAAPYDALVCLSTPPAFTIPGVPTIAWLQGPLQTELEAIRRLRRQIVRTSGRPFYAALATYYRADALLDRSVLRGVRPGHLREPVGAGAGGARWGYPADRISALPYPVDLDTFRPAPGGRESGPPTLLSLGRLDPRKRLDLLLAAFALVLDEVPDARLRIVGRPGYAPRQLSLLDGFARSDRVEYSPAVPRQEVVPLLQQATVLVQPSENENFGSSVAEALACGTPVVVGPSNGTADYVDDHSRLLRLRPGGGVGGRRRGHRLGPRPARAEVAASARSAAERRLSTSSVVDGLLEVVDGAVADHRTERSRSAR